MNMLRGFLVFFLKGEHCVAWGGSAFRESRPQTQAAAFLQRRPGSFHRQEVCGVMTCAAFYSFYLLLSRINDDKLLGCKFQSP